MLLHQSRCKVDQNGQNHQDSGNGKGHTELTLFFCIYIEGDGQCCARCCQTVDNTVEGMGKACSKEQCCGLTKNTANGQNTAGDDTVHAAGKNDSTDNSPFTGTQTKGSFTVGLRNGFQTLMRNTQESLKTVPQSYREGAFGLGAGKWRVIRTVVLPNCLDGVVTGCILSVGRILGESAALLFTAGFAHSMNGFFEGLSSAGASLTVALYVYAKEDGEFGVAFGIAAILMVLAFCINLAASAVTKYFQKKNAV